MMKKILQPLTKIWKEKQEDCADIADKRIDKKPPNSMETEKKNRS